MELIMQRGLLLGAAILALSLTGCATGAGRDLEEGWKFMLAKNYPAARDVYEGMLVEYPDNPYALLNLGVAHQYLGNIDLARQHYEAAIAHGGDAEVTRVVEEGSIIAHVTTVADKARENMATLPN
jgi:tetratricopeptide (TPR) repeat protein